MFLSAEFVQQRSCVTTALPSCKPPLSAGRFLSPPPPPTPAIPPIDFKFSIRNGGEFARSIGEVFVDVGLSERGFFINPRSPNFTTARSVTEADGCTLLRQHLPDPSFGAEADFGGVWAVAGSPLTAVPAKGAAWANVRRVAASFRLSHIYAVTA
jgi:hypothetical protein